MKAQVRGCLLGAFTVGAMGWAGLPAQATGPVVTGTPTQFVDRTTYQLPNALPDASCKTNGGIGQDHNCWGQDDIHFTVTGLEPDEDVVVIPSAHYTESFGCANTATGVIDPARTRTLTGWGGGADNGIFPFSTTDDGAASLAGAIGLHTPDPDGFTAPDGYSATNAPFLCAKGFTIVRARTVLDHVVAHLRVDDRTPGHEVSFSVAVPGVFTSTSADYRVDTVPLPPA